MATLHPQAGSAPAAPPLPEPWRSRARKALRHGRVADATLQCRAALSAKGERAPVRRACGALAFEVGDFALCAEALSALAVQELDAASSHQLGYAQLKLHNLELALPPLERAAVLAQNEPRYQHDLATAQLLLGRLSEAIEGFARVVELCPAQPSPLYNWGTALLRGDRFEAAASAFRRMLEMSPGHPEALLNLGIALKQLGDLEGALAAQRQALGQRPADPELQWNLGLTEILAGSFVEGFLHFEARLQLPGHPLRGRARWDGRPAEDPDAELRLLGEQGLGDTLQFLRFVQPALARWGGRVTLSCRGELLPLLTMAYRAPVELIATGQGAPAALCSLMSLPAVLETAGELGMAEPYLHIPEERVTAARAMLHPAGGNALGRTLRVGLCWQGNPAYRADHRRSLHLSMLAPVLALDGEGVSFVSLQHGPAAAQLLEVGAEGRVLDLGDIDPAGEAFVVTAPLLLAMDLLITTDTALAHLGGALGVPVWLLLARVPDFRWGLSGNRWYPSMRTFRQPRAGAWEPVIEEVADALRAWAGEATEHARAGGGA